MAAWIVLVVVIVGFWRLWFLPYGLERDFEALDKRLDLLEKKLEEIGRGK
jgi:hypothetical protein